MATIQIIILTLAVIGWFELFAHLGGKPHVHHRNHRPRGGAGYRPRRDR